MHHDTGPLRALQQDARQAADQLTALIAHAVAAGVHPPRLLAAAAGELWEFAGSPAAAATAKRLGWPHTFDPTAEADAMRHREFLAGAVGATSALISDALTGTRPSPLTRPPVRWTRPRATGRSSPPRSPATPWGHCCGTRHTFATSRRRRRTARCRTAC
jgi:hypothetical protein